MSADIIADGHVWTWTNDEDGVTSEVTLNRLTGVYLVLVTGHEYGRAARYLGGLVISGDDAACRDAYMMAVVDFGFFIADMP